MTERFARTAGLACFLFASMWPAAVLAATRPATDAEYRSIRETLQAQFANGATAKLSKVVVGKGRDGPSGTVRHVCGYANATRFYGTLSNGSDGKLHAMILGTRDIANTMCAEKLGV